jgi:hypothetical protein
VTADVQKHPKLIYVGQCCFRQLACLHCLVSGWHKLWAFTHFLDDDDITPDFRGFSISHEKQIVNCR